MTGQTTALVHHRGTSEQMESTQSYRVQNWQEYSSLLLAQINSCPRNLWPWTLRCGQTYSGAGQVRKLLLVSP